ncbi:tyrosine-protein phosphatase 10D isoform X3 [Bombyx mori]
MTRCGSCADLVIEIPGSGAGEDGDSVSGLYRLDYRPPEGTPAPNHTVPARASTINFQGLPGTKYHFMLYYSNSTFPDLLTWNQTIITAPEPPTNLTVTLGRNKQATISWSPPTQGNYTGFRFKVIPLTERAEGGQRNITVERGNDTHVLRDLFPGATYQLHAFTLLHDKESAAYASRNFTTKPNTPGKFIVWFRNETTLLVLWQPPYPPGAYTHYKVSIEPPDARDSVLYVEKEGEPPGPAQAAFKGLVPGRAYNISVQTVSEPEISAPTTAKYRTVPLRPRNVTAPPDDLRETAFRVTWLPPLEESEFEKYQVSVSGGGAARRLSPLLLGRDEEPSCWFRRLDPGAHYSLTVKTMAGKVTSWPAALDLTLKPLPVRRLLVSSAEGGLGVAWQPADGSAQDEYKVSYHEAGPSRDDSNTLTTTDTNVTLDALLPGRNYTVSVRALSRAVESNETWGWGATRPLAPVVVRVEAAAAALRLHWRSDVNSRQTRYVLRYRARVPEPGPPAEWRQLRTEDTSALLADLFPGAVYEIELAAMSHDLPSEAHRMLKPVRPLAATRLWVERASSNSALVQWRGPPPARSVLGHYALRYRTLSAARFTELDLLPPDAASAEITNMTHGERYVIQLDTVSEPGDGGEVVESGQPLYAEHTIRPNPVSEVAQLVGTRNVTLEWLNGSGRVDRYEVRWWPTDHAELAGLEGTDEDSARGAAGGERARNLTAPPALLAGLAPGVGYTLTLAAHSYNLTSDLLTIHTRTRPLILSEMTIVNEPSDDEEAPPGIIVLFTPTPSSATRFDQYRFLLEGAADEPPRDAALPAQPAPPAPRRVHWPGLVPGRLYDVTMWTLSANVTSHPVQRQTRLHPRPVRALNTTRVGARFVTLTWERPGGDHTDFELQYFADEQVRTLVTDRLSINATDLEPYTSYDFTVRVRSGDGGGLRMVSPERSVAVRTAEDVPAAPADFRPADARPSSLTMAWRLSAAQAHGLLRRYVLTYAPHGRPELTRSLELAAEATRVTVEGLSPGVTYELSLHGETGAGPGAAAHWTQHMAIGAPPAPPPDVAPAAVRATTTTVVVRFRSDYFSAVNGNVTAYTLVLAQENRSETPARLPSWRDVHALPVWPPYQVTEPYYPFLSSPVEEFTLGSERCEGGGRAYCNGPLKAGTRYFLKLRAFTAPDKFADTAYVAVATEVDNTAWIIGGSVCGLAVAGAALAALAASRRRRRAARAPAAPAPRRTSRPVRVADFIDHYRAMSADSDFKFSEEFEELKDVGREQPCTAADLPVNRPKNRFTNILPYDHSRYKLQPVDDEEGSDYINANYLPGYNSPREFIVTQGPLHCTRDDFWRMCWESGSRAVVMLTRCVEKGREKCDRYWPYDTRPVYYGDIAVTALNESRYPDWTVTELLVSRGKEQRVLLHFHFTTWPDFGVPEPPTTLARFVRAFRERCPADGRPVVVHCSAGVGRSGTFITLDTALQQLAARDDYVDIFGMVYNMRRERVAMVQSEQQYICIHQCLVAVLEGQDLTPPHNNNHHHNPAFEGNSDPSARAAPTAPPLQ